MAQLSAMVSSSCISRSFIFGNSLFSSSRRSYQSLLHVSCAALQRQKVDYSVTKRSSWQAKRGKHSYHGTSFLQCEHLLGADQIELRDQVRSFCLKEVAPIADKTDKEDLFPKHLWPIMGTFGILGPTVPTEYGGLGLGYLDHVLIMEEISRHSGSVALSYGAHSNLCVSQIARWGTEEQKHKYLPKLVDGSFIGGLAMSETCSGSDVISMKTKATPQDTGEYVLNGTKMWITNGPSADIVVVYAKTSPDSGSQGITAFLVEKGTPGFSAGQKLDKLGMRGSQTSELVFDNCRIPHVQVLGEVNRGARVLMSGLDTERLVLAAGPLGLMQACMDIAVPYVNTRSQFNSLIGDFQVA
eukprot:GHVQ01023543.1.p1 GENE.GHVQ01023543.1~~GHVQ01023543.1.p1  ORF type:complete len:356 (-),score=18.45 GHVQ01023543.1:394-1461(-)